MSFKFYNFFLIILSIFNISFSEEIAINENDQKIKQEAIFNKEKQESQYVPLSESEAKELLESLNDQEKQSFQKFFNELSSSLQSIKDADSFKDVQKILENRDYSLSIFVNLVPTKYVKSPTETEKSEQTFNN